jgi:hypothetical protein
VVAHKNEFYWDHRNTEAVEKHGLTRQDVEHVVWFAKHPFPQRFAGRASWRVIGKTPSYSPNRGDLLHRSRQADPRLSRDVKHMATTPKPKRSSKPKVKLPPKNVKLRDIWDDLSDDQREPIIDEQIAAAHAGEPPTPDPEEDALHAEVMARLRGRPRIGQGAARLNVTMERSLLSRLDAYAKKNHLTRAAALALSVEDMLQRKAG